HPANGRGEETPLARVESRHRPGAVYAGEPVGPGAGASGGGPRQNLLVAAQVLEAVADRGRRHALQPEALDWLLRLRMLLDQAKDELALAPRVAGVDELGDVLALDELDDGVEPTLCLVERRQVEMRRDHRQVREAPLAALDVELLRRLD